MITHPVGTLSAGIPPHPSAFPAPFYTRRPLYASGAAQGKTPISGRSRADLRVTAWRAVWAAVPDDLVMAARFGHPTTWQDNRLARRQARAACAAALLRWIHVVVTRHVPWDPAIAAGTSAARRTRAALATSSKNPRRTRRRVKTRAGRSQGSGVFRECPLCPNRGRGGGGLRRGCMVASAFGGAQVADVLDGRDDGGADGGRVGRPAAGTAGRGVFYHTAPRCQRCPRGAPGAHAVRRFARADRPAALRASRQPDSEIPGRRVKAEILYRS
jgi:hypothetical protein